MAKLKDGYFKNIGSAEGNDSYALLAGGGHLSYSNSGGANALVQRDANGYIVNNYFNTTGGGSEKNASGLEYIAGFNISDYYIRSYTSAAVKSWLGLGSNAYTSTAYLPLSGGTLTGALNFKNGTWNNVGDDVAIGDINVSGQLGIKALNTANPGIAFYNNSAVAVGNLISNAGTLQWSGSTIWHAGNFNPASYLPLTGGTVTGKTIIKKDLGANLSDWVASQHNGTFEVGRASNTMCVAIGVTDDNYGYIQVKGNGITTPGNLVILPGGGVVTIGSPNNASLAVSGAITSGGNAVLHAGNYNSYSPTLTGGNASGTWGINVTGAANRLYQGGTTSGSAMVFNWSGQSGQPTWLWGGTDGTNMYVYNPSNFNVASAVYLRNAGTGMLNVPSTGQIRYDYNVLPTAGLFPSGNNANSILSINRHAGSYDSQLGFSSDGNIYYRSFNATALDTTTGWRTILDSTNYNTYAPTKTGTGASGTWGINISGNAATASTASTANTANTANTASKTNGISGYAHAGTGMYAFYNWGGSDGGASAPNDSTYTIGISVGSHPGDQSYGFQIGRNMWNTGLWTRGYDSGWGTWYRILDSGNYSSYSPTLTGGGASGTWGINISGNSETATRIAASVGGTNTIELVRGNMADNDQFRILVGGTASNSGYVEIATADDGTEPIYVRQYTGVFTSLVRTATLLDEAGNTSFPGTVTASRFACSANNLMAMKDGYLAFQTYAGGITVGCTIDSPIYINNSAALGTTPTTWHWKAGSSSSWANFYIGSLNTNGTISASSTITTASYVSSAQGYYKSGSSNDYVLLGGGSHKSISDFRLKSEKVLKMVFRGYFTWSGTNSAPTNYNVVYSDFCTSYSISRVSTGRYRITFTGLKTTSSIASDTTLQIFGVGRNINSNDGNPCYVAISNIDTNYFDIIIADDNTTNDSPIFTLYINQML